MAGLRLSMSSGVGVAAPPSQAGTTITSQAFGVGSGADVSQPTTAAKGSIGVSLAALGLLVWLWWTLPR